MKAIYPGTFNPITNGHADVVSRAAQLFDEVIVAVADSSGKNPVFSLDQRVGLAKSVLADFDNVTVMPFGNLLVDFAKANGAQALIRGLRAVSDFEYELQMAHMNRRLDHEIESLFLMPSEEHAFISSSLVREVAALGGDVKPLVHDTVAAALAEKYGT